MKVGDEYQTESGIKFTIKLMTLTQRAECNDFPVVMNMKEGTLTLQKTFSQYLKYLEHGLKTLNNIEITKDNFEEEINKLDTNEIRDIGDIISEEINFSKKKSSKLD